ncbi:MAG: dephospho-CoA kinase [Ruminococcus sp.]|nr:dephospho-CoA kinase [Ruminococcus sp.]
MKNSVIVGLTGQTGAGKSTISAIFREKGYSIIDADMIARQVMEKGKPCLAEIIRTFGGNIIDDNGNLYRKKLAEIVFSDKENLEKLNSITYPYIITEISDNIDSLVSQDNKFILLDAPTLFESNADRLCDVIVSVLAEPEIRKKRIISRDNLTPEQAQKRMNSQHNDGFFIENSDYIINNNDLPDKLGEKVAGIVGRIEKLLEK